MVRVPGGRFMMGSSGFYPEERPPHPVAVDSFWIDIHPVTNAEFRRFVDATGYLTFSERVPDPKAYPDADPEMLAAGSLVFQKPSAPVSLRDYRAWWAYVPGANWRTPQGSCSDLTGRDDHPVVHVTYEDCLAYANWAGKSLPTEAEWEFAARGGLEGAPYAWGDELLPNGRVMANTWQGRFPWENLLTDGFEGTSPVHAFPANGYGLHDMIGNVWEWTSSIYRSHAESARVQAPKACCVPERHATATERRVVKGGSHLCAPNYCLRYRPAARQGEAIDTSTCHIGFRCVVKT